MNKYKQKLLDFLDENIYTLKAEIAWLKEYNNFLLGLDKEELQKELQMLTILRGMKDIESHNAEVEMKKNQINLINQLEQILFKNEETLKHLELKREFLKQYAD